MQWLTLALFLAADSPTQATLPSGQDDVFAELLGKGATLPDGCVWGGALIDRSFVVSQYECGGKTVKLTLKHPTDVNAPNAIAHTQRFVFFGEIPTALREDLVARVQAGEARVKWDLTELPTTRSGGPPPIPFPRTLALVLVLSVFTAMLGALTARWASARWKLPERPALLRVVACVALSLAGGALLRDALRHSMEFALGQLQRGPSYASVFVGFTLGIALVSLGASLVRRGGLVVLLTLTVGFVTYWMGSLPREPLTMFGNISTLSPGMALYPLNSRGFRGPEFSLEKKPGVTRVALIGDSFVEGEGILQEDQTLAMQLQRELASRNPSATWEVLNLGIAGNNLESHVSTAEEALKQLDLDTLVVCLTLNNDLSSLDGQVLRAAARRPSSLSFTRALFGESAVALAMRFSGGGPEPTPREIENVAAQSMRLSELHRQFPKVQLVVFSFHRPQREIISRFEQPMLWPPTYDDGDFIAGDGHPTDHGAHRFAQEIANAILAEPPK